MASTKIDHFLKFIEVDRNDKYGFYGFVLYEIGDPDNWDSNYRTDKYTEVQYFSKNINNFEVLFYGKKKKEAEKFLENLKKQSPYSEWIEEWDFQDTTKKYNL